MTTRSIHAFLSTQGQLGVGGTVQAITASGPHARTMWEFMDEYEGDDKIIRILNSFAAGFAIGGGMMCSGTMISPHIFMTAAHCGGPDHAFREVFFFRIDEDTGPIPGNQVQSGPYRARSFPWSAARAGAARETTRARSSRRARRG